MTLIPKKKHIVNFAVSPFLRKNPGFWLASCVVGFYLLFLLHQYKKFGISFDEVINEDYGKFILDYYRNFPETPGTFPGFYAKNYYPGLYPMVVQFIVSLCPPAYHGFETAHLVLGLFQVGMFVGIWKLAREIFSPSVAAISLLLLLISPRFFGEMPINIKDPPFAMFYTWTLYYVVLLAKNLSNIRPRVIFCLAIALGLTLSIRINGGILILYILFLLIPHLRKTILTRKYSQTLDILASMIAVISIAFLIVFISWPWLHDAPLSNLLSASSVMLNYGWNLPVLFNGEQTSALNLPRTYVPMWLLISTPLVVLLFFAKASINAFIERDANNEWVPFLILSIFIPIIFVVAANSAKYDGIRHYLFLYPSICVVAANGLFDTLKSSRVLVRVIAVVFSLANTLTTVYSMIQLHPYEYSYFNELIGGLNNACEKYDSEYWGTSAFEHIEYLNDLGMSRQSIVSISADSLAPVVERYAQDRKWLRFVVDKDDAEYILTSYRYGECRKEQLPIVKKASRSGCVFSCLHLASKNSLRTL